MGQSARSAVLRATATVHKPFTPCIRSKGMLPLGLCHGDLLNGQVLDEFLGNARSIVGTELTLLRLLGVRRRHASLRMLHRRRAAVRDVSDKDSRELEVSSEGVPAARD